MKTVELSAALGQAQVVENLKNFVGVDAQGAAALMTPERLAAVAGGKVTYDNSGSNKNTLLRVCSLKQWEHTLIEICCSQSSVNADVIFCQICNHSEGVIRAKIKYNSTIPETKLYLKKDDNSFWIDMLPYSSYSIRICTGTDLVYDLKTTATDDTGLELIPYS